MLCFGHCTKQVSTPNSGDKLSVWLLELNSLGYVDPLFAPLLVVHATIAAIGEPEIHTFIQTTDLNAHED